MQPSASKTDLLLECPFPFDPGLSIVSISGPAADYGNAFHGMSESFGPCMEPMGERAALRLAKSLVKKWNVKDYTAADLHKHVLSCQRAFTRWFNEEAPFGDIEFASRVEVSMAYDPWQDKARIIEPPNEHHVYQSITPDEIPGTSDRVFVALDGKQGPVYVFDYKTGSDPPMPQDSAQLKTLGLSWARITGRDEVHVGIVHSPPDSMTTIQVARLNAKTLEAHRKDLRRAMARIGDGSLRPGGHCTSMYCPALLVCPSKTSALAAMEHNGKAMTAVRVGKIHMACETYDRMREQLRHEMRAWIEQNGPALRPDGQIVVLRRSERENLSKSSIEKALGAKGAEKVINELRAAGCISTSERVEIHAERERGR